MKERVLPSLVAAATLSPVVKLGPIELELTLGRLALLDATGCLGHLLQQSAMPAGPSDIAASDPPPPPDVIEMAELMAKAVFILSAPLRETKSLWRRDREGFADAAVEWCERVPLAEFVTAGAAAVAAAVEQGLKPMQPAMEDAGGGESVPDPA